MKNLTLQTVVMVNKTKCNDKRLCLRSPLFLPILTKSRSLGFRLPASPEVKYPPEGIFRLINGRVDQRKGFPEIPKILEKEARSRSID